MSIKDIENSTQKLHQLKDALSNKRRFLINSYEIGRLDSFINRIDIKIRELYNYKSLLNNKYIILMDILDKYSSIYLKIPKYYKLKQEITISYNF